MRILLSSYGSRGDVEPVMALAVALQAQGVEVRVCIPSDYEFIDLAERVGVAVTTFAKSWRSWATASSTAEETVPSVDEYVAGYIGATYDTLAAEAEEADGLIASGMLHFVAQSIAEKVSIPYRFTVFCPSVLAPQGWQPLVAPAINGHRASIGLPPIKDVRTFLFTAEPWLAADPVLSPPAAEAPAVVRSGAWILSDARALPADLVAFLEAGSPPVYVGYGSMRMSSQSAGIAIAAIRSQGQRVLIGRGWAGLGPIDEDKDCFAVGEVNQQALFPRLAAVIHHGGAGTTTTAARAGVPQVIVPQAADQPYWADQVTRLSIGAAHVGPNPTIATLTAALQSALRPESVASARQLASQIRTDGARAAAERVIDLAEGERS
jgi:vancomycin aglycone glucosyltransferase